MALHRLTLLVTMSVTVFPGVTACELIFCPLSQSDGTPVRVTGTADVIIRSEGLTHCALKCQRDNCSVFTFDEEGDVCSLYGSVKGMTVASLESPTAYQDLSKQLSYDRTAIQAPDCSFPFTFKGVLYNRCLQTVSDPVKACNKYSCMIANRTWVTCQSNDKDYVASATYVTVTYDVNQPSPDSATGGSVKVQSQMIARWLLFQQRISDDLDFNRSWAEYANGFGSPQNNFYLGNEPASQLTNDRPYSLRVELLIDGAWYSGEYWRFSVNRGSSIYSYSLSVSGFSGDLKDAMSLQNGKMFRTYDAPIIGCETFPLNSGWWYEMPAPPCGGKQPPFMPIANLNAPFGSPSPFTIHWSAVGSGSSFGGSSGNIEQTRMMIRPVD